MYLECPAMLARRHEFPKGHSLPELLALKVVLAEMKMTNTATPSRNAKYATSMISMNNNSTSKSIGNTS
jgi:hypothetical protein